LKAQEVIMSNIKSRGISQAHISRRTGIKPSRLSMMLSGDLRMPIDDFVLICKAVKVDPTTMLSTHNNGNSIQMNSDTPEVSA